MRKATVVRDTKETKISIDLSLEGGRVDIKTGSGFFDHMLTLFASHGNFGLIVKCAGDVDVDFHHSVEDIGIVLGEAFKQALGDKVGINRYGDIILPMDEALILTAVDLSGRAYLGFDLRIPTPFVGTFDTELTEEFFWAFVRNAACTLHLKKLAGKNSHHIIEGAFKSAARSLRAAVAIDAQFKDEIPSTKGVL